LVLSTQDRSTPALKLSGLSADVVQLYERLRKATELEKRRRGVRVLDADPVA
jgi:20S proteasome alpha/beta subunit